MALGTLSDWLVPIGAAGAIGFFVWGLITLLAGSRATVRDRLGSYATAGGAAVATAGQSGRDLGIRDARRRCCLGRSDPAFDVVRVRLVEVHLRQTAGVKVEDHLRSAFL